MSDDKIVKIAAVTIVAVIAIPILVKTAVIVGSATYCGITNAINTAKYKKKIKKGLKDGSIVERDGQYFEVEVTDIEEA